METQGRFFDSKSGNPGLTIVFHKKTLGFNGPCCYTLLFDKILFIVKQKKIEVWYHFVSFFESILF